MKSIYNLPDNLKISSSMREELKDLFSGCHINFLLGAGYSYGILSTLGDYEYILEGLRTYIAVEDRKKKKYQILRRFCSLGG